MVVAITYWFLMRMDIKMHRVLGHLLRIAIVVFGFSILLDGAYSYTFRNSLSRNKRQELLMHKNNKFDILFLGSSRTESHIVDSVFERITNRSILNAGMERATLHDSYAILHSLIKNNNKFNECWIQLDYTHNMSNHSANMFAEIVPFLNDEKLSSHALEIKQTSPYRMPFQLYMQNDKPIGFREFFLRVIKKRPGDDITLRYKPLSASGTGSKGKWPDTLSPNLAIEKMKLLASKHKFELKFYTSPNCPLESNRDTFANQLKEQYAFDNYYAIFDDSLNYFYDCGHLNHEGATAFTKLLANDYLKPK
jgi:hypothetical protein